MKILHGLRRIRDSALRAAGVRAGQPRGLNPSRLSRNSLTGSLVVEPSGNERFHDEVYKAACNLQRRKMAVQRYSSLHLQAHLNETENDHLAMDMK